ncbi:MAG TPA: malate dehydrogenase [Candidatus Limosilactobacillus merdipullorum]|uniref:Malate dehydrogenase n=1 Tax=Candidatus Limosilactobacillus merdipullorum TaxID=2838653 RepID=A0A9D1QNF2_9LACO|nr:malate dehydrogenase [Candidatus Limosilactobacillus merdipullorum]
MRNIGIVGLGHVGLLLANLLVDRQAVDELVLIDQDDQRVRAVTCDLVDALPSHLPVIKEQDFAALKTADVIVIAAGNGASLKTGRFAELVDNAKMIQQVAPRIAKSGFSGVVVNMSNPNEATTALWQQALGLPRKQVIGTGTILDTQRAQVAVARQGHLNSQMVTGFVLGQHDGSLVFPWLTWQVNGQTMGATVNGYRLDQHQLAIKARESTWITMEGLGYDATGLCFAALRIIGAVLSDSGLVLPVAVYQPQFSTYLSYPVAIGQRGAGNFTLLKLLPVEQEQLLVAAKAVINQVASQQE